MFICAGDKQQCLGLLNTRVLLLDYLWHVEKGWGEPSEYGHADDLTLGVPNTLLHVNCVLKATVACGINPVRSEVSSRISAASQVNPISVAASLTRPRKVKPLISYA